MNLQRHEYYSEIDGLRAIAVLAVLLFHLEIPGFDGGFIGVDVFFVISGYLITKNIVNAKISGTFSFSSFYIGRVFRLLPALFVTVLVTQIAAFFILTPEHLSALGGASVASVFSFSNILFWWEAGYFDEAKTFKPLLHTWSLGVEEQFYLIWPLIVCLCVSINRKFAQLSMVAILSVSFILAESLLSDYRDLVFYWMPFRIGEFAMGAVLVFFARPRHDSFSSALAGLLGLSLILIPIFIYSESTQFPGIMAAIPCIGAALMILFGRSKFVNGLLTNDVSIYLGKISYSLYLVHWPVIVLVSYSKLGGIGPRSLLLVMPSIFLLAMILHHGIEQRFRLSNGEQIRKANIVKICFSGLFIAGLGLGMSLGKGWEWRYPEEAKPIISSISNLDTLEDEKQNLLFEIQNSFLDDANVSKHFIIGDSFAEDTMLALRFAYPKLNIKLLKVIAQCQPILPGSYNERDSINRKCNEMRTEAFDIHQLRKASSIYLAASWREPSFSNLDKALVFLAENTSARIFVVGARASFHDVPTLAMKHRRAEGLVEFVDKYKKRSYVQANNQLKAIAEQHGAEFVDVNSLLCPEELCIVLSPIDNKIVYSDYAHLTISGARFLGSELNRKSLAY